MTKAKKTEDAIKEAVVAVLADPEEDRPPAQIESEAGLAPGTLVGWLKDDPVFRRRLDAALAANQDLDRLSVLKSLAAKAKEGSVQHQKYFLERAEAAGQEDKKRLVVELIVRDAPADKRPASRR